MRVSRFLLTTAALCASGVASTALKARPVPLETPQVGTVINQQEIQNTGRTSISETLQKLPRSPGDWPPPARPLQPAEQVALDAHNAIRAKLGSPPMQWDFRLEQYAIGRSLQLSLGGAFAHAPRAGREDIRENILKAPASYPLSAQMKVWTDEYKDFVPGVFPNVCRSGGDCSRVLHLTQMAWPTTFYVGCGSAVAGGFVYTVCGYPKGGNQDGKEIGTQWASRNAYKYAVEQSRRALPPPGVLTGSDDPEAPSLPQAEVVKGTVDKLERPSLPPAEVVKGTTDKLEPPSLPPAEVVPPKPPETPPPPTMHDRIERVKQALQESKRCDLIDTTEIDAVEQKVLSDWQKWSLAGKAALEMGAPVDEAQAPLFRQARSNWYNANHTSKLVHEHNYQARLDKSCQSTTPVM